MSADAATTDKIIARKEGAVGWLIFNNPECRNAVSLDMTVAAGQVLEDFGADDSVRVVILRGAGDKAFISGADVSKFESQRATAEALADSKKITSRMFELMKSASEVVLAMHTEPQPHVRLRYWLESTLLVYLHP